MNTVTIPLEHGSITRVSYLDAPIPAEFVGLTEDQVNQVGWAEPLWAEAGQVKFGAAVWIADIGDTRIAFDPVMAADSILRATPEAELEQQLAIAASIESAGYPLDSVDFVLLSHFDGVGAIGHVSEDRVWSPFFPGAKILISDVLMSDFIGADQNETNPEREAFLALISAGHFDTFPDGEEVFPGVKAIVNGAHSTGHAVFEMAGKKDDKRYIFIGHLAISPLHLVTGPNEAFHNDAAAAYELLEATAATGKNLIGPLWPAPGVARMENGQLVVPSI